MFSGGGLYLCPDSAPAVGAERILIKPKRLPGHLVPEERVALFRGNFSTAQEKLCSVMSLYISACTVVKRLKLESPRLSSEETVLTGHVGETAEGVGAAGGQTGAQLWSSAHRAGHHLSGELWIDVLEVSRASLGK